MLEVTRTLGIISLHLKVLSHRGAFDEVEAGCYELIRRAKSIEHDDWQRLSYLVRGFHFLEQAHSGQRSMR
jgi:hypothetical protein